MNKNHILQQIKKDVINPTTIHALDEKRVARTFYEELQSNGWYGVDEVQDVIDKLGSQFSEYTKERIFTIAEVIQKLRDQP